MAEIRIIIDHKHHKHICMGDISEALVQNGINARFNFTDVEGGRVSHVMEQILISDKAEAYVLPAKKIPYPLNTQLEVLALLPITEKQNKTDYPLFENDLKKNPLEDYLAVVGKKGMPEIKKCLEQMDVRARWGKVILAGFGPGDHDLITKKAAFHLECCDVIFYDDLVDEVFLHGFEAEKIYVGKRKGKHKFDQEIINEWMYQEAIKGKNVVRVKGGDPLIFGRGAEEYHYLQSRLVQATIIPGISSAFAAAAQAVIPFTERSLSSSVALLSGHDMHKLKIPKADTLVFYMGASNQKELAQEIIAQGWSEGTPVGVVYNVSNPNQQIYRGTLGDMMINGSGLPSPAIIIVGRTAGTYSSPNQKWLYTGAALEETNLKPDMIHTPLISIVSNPMDVDIKWCLAHISSYNRIIFTSRYAVRHFYDKLCHAGKDVRDLHGVRIDSIGKTTSKALKEIGLMVKPLSVNESIEGMLKVYRETGLTAENVLLPGSKQSTGLLQKELCRLGNKAHALKVYKVVKNKAIIRQNLMRFHGIVFSSPATVEAFIAIYGSIPSHLQLKCIGQQTKDMLRKSQMGEVKIEVEKRGCAV
ncbi:uroporphyrinogen-III C-methyltransferase [Saccharicrinis carchari]|uniref:uroporphyrinogen-III C-methyltransferase n=1 Tax=Saccharicrinis carchari TaxID=1168039 RepID=A0A521EQU0_SACCC|nr:uroporphyrinogen-III C-methyltransferase [Saccharicrinis carchari]SMO86265.1 uroporphyrinogen-III C-methyltransferase [Saccharicrinis carchari]